MDESEKEKVDLVDLRYDDDNLNIKSNKDIDQSCKEILKRKLTAILLGAVNRTERKYFLANGQPNWSAVESDMHSLIDNI